jgi:hypothetical protein
VTDREMFRLFMRVRDVRPDPGGDGILLLLDPDLMEGAETLAGTRRPGEWQKLGDVTKRVVADMKVSRS